MSRPIALVAGKDPLQGIGGHSRYVRAHARAARVIGFEPHVFCFSDESGAVETDFGLVHRARLPWRLERHPRLAFRRHLFVWRQALVARAVVGFVRAHPETRVIHSFGIFAGAGVAASRALARSGIDTVPIASAYDTLAREAAAKAAGARRSEAWRTRLGFAAELAFTRLVVDRCEARGYAASRLVLVNYASVRRALAEGYGLRARVRLVSYGPETAFVHAPDARRPTPDAVRALEPRGAPMIVALSRHDPRKGVDVLLHALARLRRDGIRFRACLVGGGPLLAAHRRLCQRLGLAAATALPGFVPETRAYLEHADVFSLPSLEEGGGSLALLEALQAGVAVVASDVDGVPEDVTDGESGLLVAPGDPDALARALGRVLTDAPLRARLACAGRAVFVRRFSAQTFVAALAGAYEAAGAAP